MPSYYGIIIADSTQGVLLGGGNIHKSSRMETYDMANDWLNTCIEQNLNAGRKIHQSKVAVSPKPPEIFEKDVQ